ncbi:MAG: lipoyl(octanoyl) transferase LipB [Saprospiraceae bacterium]|nr:lipoyl(octanoyl) transferase LipB [Saprospiraceae bacterium]
MQRVVFQDLGKIDYQQAWDYQTGLHRELVSLKLENRQRAADGLPPLVQRHYLLFCEHPPVYTLGKSGSEANLLLDEQSLESQQFQFFRINRGGDITYHGPGQIVGYPIFDLDCFFTDVHRYVRFLEEAVIRTLAEYGIAADREQGYTGVWLPATALLPRRKICAIGVHLSRWVTLHGFAFNVNTDLSHFENIIPCGITDTDKTVTSMKRELNQNIEMNEVKLKLKAHFSELFGFEFSE